MISRFYNSENKVIEHLKMISRFYNSENKIFINFTM